MLLASSRRAGGALVLFGLLLTPTADAQNAGFAINRFDPVERGSDWFAADSLDLRGHGRVALGVTGDWSEKPLVLYGRDGDELQSIIEHQLFVHAGASLVLWERVRLGINLPVLAYQAGEDGTLQGTTYQASESTALGDLRLGADARLLGQCGAPISVAGGVSVFAPTANQAAFASMKWLIDHGIAKTRLSSKGSGMEKPIDDNDSDAARQNNCRVEFHILETDGQPLPSE